jgi:tRNA 2-thiocytidine biosynthesis protein TtcA
MKKGQTERKIRWLAAQAVHRYGMIVRGDRILAAVSGGKDSLTMLWYLTDALKRAPIKYEIIPVYLEMGFNVKGIERMEEYFALLGLSYHVEATRYGLQAHERSGKLNPCFVCSRRRRKRLFDLAQELNCNKIALGHNQDDLIETFLLNMLFGAETSTMKPLQPFFQGKIIVIRPLAFSPRAAIESLVAETGLPSFDNPCPSARNSQRMTVLRLLKLLYRKNPKIRGNLFHAMHNINSEYLLS